MTTSVFFNKFDYTNEQQMLDNLVIEAIQIHGQDMIYMPIRKGSFDGLFFEDDASVYDTYYTIETYVKSYEGFQGQQSFMSTIGLEIRDQIILSIAFQRFKEEVTSKEPTLHRPLEGDLIYFPLNKKLFKVMFVDDKPFFYQFGKLQMFDMTCELFEYSNEVLNTGIEEVDSLQKTYSLNAFDWQILLENGNYLASEDRNAMIVNEQYNNYSVIDPAIDNDRIEEEQTANSIIDFSEDNPFADGQW